MGRENEAKAKHGRISSEFTITWFGTEDSPTQLEGPAGEILSVLLDTNVISQLTKDEPHSAVHRWLAEAAEAADEEMYLSVISVEEIREGVELMSPGKKKRRLDLWLSEEILQDYRDRILPVTIEIADVCGRILGGKETRGLHLETSDAYIAATARVHGLALATLNRKHFERLGVELVEF
jgi:toxin FitB